MGKELIKCSCELSISSFIEHGTWSPSRQQSCKSRPLITSKDHSQDLWPDKGKYIKVVPMQWEDLKRYLEEEMFGGVAAVKTSEF